MSTIGDNNDHQPSGGEEITENEKECTSCEQNNVDNITEGIGSISTLKDMTTCANCGKQGNSDDMNTCNKCKMVKYCNAACKKKHRTKHKKACERRVAELHDEQLFNEVEPEECPICMLPLPLETNTSTFKSCCGKRVCNGCVYAMEMSEGKDLCAFCRTPPPTSNEHEIERVKKLMDKDNAGAINHFAGYYVRGLRGIPQDYQKASELFLKAGKLGCAVGYYHLGYAYHFGYGVEVDTKKAQHYWTLAALTGYVHARHSLGNIEFKAGNMDRAMKHWLIAARAGQDYSLDCVKAGYKNGLITKDEYADILRAYQARRNEMKSDEREAAAKVFRQ